MTRPPKPPTRGATGSSRAKPPGGASQAGLGGGRRPLAERLHSTEGRSTTQQKWLTRQLNDPYVAAARAQGFRSRAAFKLIELDERHKLIRRGARVLDLGAAPGGWSQVAAQRGAARIVGLDLLAIDPVAGAVFVQGDFHDPDMPAHLLALLGGAPDLVLSDIAPNTTGHAFTDNARIVALAELALDLAVTTLTPGGGFVAKLFQGGAERDMLVRMKQRFASVRHAKPPASRKDSRELYVVATGFRPE